MNKRLVLLLAVLVTVPFLLATGSTVPGPAPANLPCRHAVETTVVYDGGPAASCPAFPLAGRRSVTMCNSPKNDGGGNWTLRLDNTVPTTAATSPGQVLRRDDCANYELRDKSTDGGVAVYCIADVGSTILLVTECM